MLNWYFRGDEDLKSGMALTNHALQSEAQAQRFTLNDLTLSEDHPPKAQADLVSCCILTLLFSGWRMHYHGAQSHAGNHSRVQ